MRGQRECRVSSTYLKCMMADGDIYVTVSKVSYRDRHCECHNQRDLSSASLKLLSTRRPRTDTRYGAVAPAQLPDTFLSGALRSNAADYVLPLFIIGSLA